MPTIKKKKGPKNLKPNFTSSGSRRSKPKVNRRQEIIKMRAEISKE